MEALLAHRHSVVVIRSVFKGRKRAGTAFFFSPPSDMPLSTARPGQREYWLLTTQYCLPSQEVAKTSRIELFHEESSSSLFKLQGDWDFVQFFSSGSLGCAVLRLFLTLPEEHHALIVPFPLATVGSEPPDWGVVMHQPRGGTKKLTFGPLKVVSRNGKRMYAHSMVTDVGSTGAPVFDPKRAVVVALHWSYDESRGYKSSMCMCAIAVWLAGCCGR